MCGSMVLIRGVDQMCGNGCATLGRWFACVDRPVGSAFFVYARVGLASPPSNLRRRGGCWPNFASYQLGRIACEVNRMRESMVLMRGMDQVCGKWCAN